MTLATSSGARPSSGRAWRLAFVLVGLALAANLLLVGSSVAFLAAVALAGAGPAALTMNFHMPAAFVRLFALTRTGAKYGERMAGHRAALADQVVRRAGLFGAMARAPATRPGGWQLGHEDRLSDYLDDVNDRDYARLRVGLPGATAGVAVVLLAAATAYIAPLALPVVALLALAAGWLARGVAARIAEAEAEIRTLRRRASAGTGAILAALVPLDAEGDRQIALTAAMAPLAAAQRLEAAGRQHLAGADLLLGLAGPLAGLAVLAAAWHAGARAEALLPAAFVAFAWVALAEPLLGLSRALLGAVRAKLANASLAGWTDAARDDDDAAATLTGAGASLTLADVALRAPDGPLLGSRLDLNLRPGEPVVLKGASGCGKTSLLKMIAGWSDYGERILIGGQPMEAAQRRALTHLGLHDAAILADTIRENLFAPDRPDADLDEALAAVELDGRVAAAGGLDAWITQDDLSLGEAQRINLARALLSRAPILLLDEPAEHLGDAQADRILRRLLARLQDRVVILTSHRSGLQLPARQVTLDA
jgi:ABC-type transport system involved in cytochrome bd biosynthesis fused ATPase/permease subunit